MRRLVPLAAVALAFAGCGGDGGNGGGTTSATGGDGDERLSREEFIREADAICAAARREFEEFEEAETEEEVADAVAEAVPRAEGVLEDLRELRPPEELQSEYEDYLEAVDDGIGILDDFGQAVREADAAQVAEIDEELDAIDERTTEAADAIGFRECGA